MKKTIQAIVLFFLVNLSYSQTLSNFQNIKVDNLSDAQIEQLIKNAEAQGLNSDQLIRVASERGMSSSETSKLRERINSMRRASDQTLGATKITTNTGALRSVEGSNQVEPFDSSTKSDSDDELTLTQEKIFGYKIFFNKRINFSPSLNIPTPPNYILGAGDQVLIDVFGASQQSYDVTVSPEGKILIPNIGTIQVGGSTVMAASARIKTALSKIYSGLAGNSPNTFLEIRLGNIKTVNVALVGELNRPGSYALPSFASPINALFAAGGPNENGSLRHIQIYRDNRLLEEIDIYAFISKGEYTSQLTLRDNDVIIVPPVRMRIELVGPVRRQGLFEVKPGESLSQILNFAGGFGSEAYKERINVTRKTGKELKVEDVDQFEFDSFNPQDGDLIRVGSIQNRFENRIQVSGAVQRPGTYALSEGMGIKELIEKAEGLREDAFLNRSTLYRSKADFTMEIFSVDVHDIVSGSVPDIALMREDLLVIPSVYDLKEAYYVKISGEINNPGTFPYGEKMKVSDLVLKAGGFKESATSSRIEIARRIRDDVSGKLAEIIVLDIDKDLSIAEEKSEELLRPFDHVIIRKSPGFQRTQMVQVDGEAIYPGEFAISHADERISDLLNRAGGLTPYAYPKGATLIRRNEFFENPTDDQIKETDLDNLQKIFKKDSLEWTQSEKVLMKSIKMKLLEKIELEKSGGAKNEKLSENLRKESLLTLAESDENISQIKFKEVELIGIDLQGIINNPHGPLDLILKEGDVLSIPKELQTVRIRGEVLFPTTVRYDNSRGFRSYISKSGGFTEKARKSRSYVVYANGNVKRSKNIFLHKFYPKVEPGAEIIIPQKPERPSAGPQQWVAIGTGLATFGLIVVQILNFVNTP